jgi:hypothetical protein
MAKRHNLRKRNMLFLAIVVATILIIVNSLLYLSSHDFNNSTLRDQKATCEITDEMKASGSYKVPCDVYFTTFEAAPLSNEQVVNMIKPINGKLISPGDGSNGWLYEIRVPAGTESSAIDYLNTQPGVNGAVQNSCCNVAI